MVFGPIARLAGGKKDWDQASAGDLYNFRSKLRSTDEAKFNAFESIPDKQTRQFIASFDAAYPGMYDYKFTQSGNSLFDDNPKSPTFKTVIINVNDKPGMIKALAGHEINHALQFKNQSDDAVKSLMLGSEGKKGLVRDADGNLDPEFKAWGDEYNSRLEAQDIPTKSVDDLAIEYYTDIGAQTLFEDVVSGRVYKAGQKTKARRKIEEMFNKTMSATPIIKDLHFKFGGATDGNGRMIMGSGLLADGIRELPEVKAMVRNMYRESAGLPSKSEVAPNDGFSQSTNPIHHQAADAIRELNQAAVKSKTPLIDAALQPDSKGNGAGRLPSEYFEELEARGIIPEGTWGMAVDINENMDLPVSYLLNYRPVRQGRSAQIDGRTANNVKFIGWGLYNGRLYLAAMDMNQLNINISRAAKSNVAKNLKMSRNDIMNDIDAVADLQSKNKSTDDYFKRVAEEAGQGKKWELRKKFINATQGLLTPEQAVKNPMFNALGQTTKSGIYRTFAFDLLDNATRMTGVKVVDYGPNSYYTLKTNLMPQMPRVNRNGELVTEPTSVKGVRFMPEQRQMPEVFPEESKNWFKQNRSNFIHVNIRGNEIDSTRDFTGWVLPVGRDAVPDANVMNTRYGNVGKQVVLVPKEFVTNSKYNPDKIKPGFRPSPEQIGTITEESINKNGTIDWSKVFAKPTEPTPAPSQRFMPKSGKKQSGKVRRSTFEGSSTKPKNNKKIADSISLLLSGQSSRQMEREERNNQ